MCAGDLLDGLGDVRPIQRLILIVEHREVGDAQDGGGGAQFLLADLAQTRGAWMLEADPCGPGIVPSGPAWR